jgi:multicomponent Na+:H+ antiporter subunit E
VHCLSLQFSPMQTIRFLSLFSGLAALWLLWSGLYLPLMLGLGLASCLLVVWIVRRFETVDQESVPIQLGLGVLTYWGWLAKEIVVSSLQVSKIVLSPSMPISPRVVSVQSLAEGEVGRVLFGNSITLTPGTLTMDISPEGMVTVHALTHEGAQGVLAGEMNTRVGAFEGKAPP